MILRSPDGIGLYSRLEVPRHVWVDLHLRCPRDRLKLDGCIGIWTSCNTWFIGPTRVRNALTSVRIVPKICQGQLQIIYSECPKFHPYPFTSGRFIAARANIVETRHDVFPILGEYIG